MNSNIRRIGTTFIMLIIHTLGNAQVPYIDVLTAPSLAAYSNQIKTEQKNTVDKMKNLAQLQSWTAAQMVLVNKTQDKVYKGLKEVHGSVLNGLQITRIYSNLEKSTGHIDAIYNEISDAPEYSVFGHKAINQVFFKVTDIYADAYDIITSSETNLATAGDRKRLLYNLEKNTKLLNMYLINVKLTIRRAKRKGFWKSINPLENYINTDRAIFKKIMQESGHL